MPRLDYVHCRDCGGHSRDVGQLSHTRLCLPCAERILAENVTGLIEHRGPAFLRYRRAVAASVGAVLIEPTRS